MVAQLRVSSPEADEVVLSGRMSADPAVRARLEELLGGELPCRILGGFAPVSKQGAQGAAILADGLAGGSHRHLVELMRLREARGTVFDNLYVISPAEARRGLGLGPSA